MSIRKRLTQEESRTVALEAARALLIELGPQAVTLKAVASRIGRTHANLLHHFGSAAGLQKELAGHLAVTICATIEDAVLASRAGEGSPREVVDLTFDAFDKEGGGALATWMLMNGNEDALDPLLEAIHELVDDLGDHETAQMHDVTHALCVMALGDALMGAQLAQSLGLPRTSARDMAEKMLIDGAIAAGIVVPGQPSD
ncbi:MULTISPECIES: helix-turn-helix domain-containing protein [unclassified Novosphingobium]|uniref:TetR/AcrR family transcriptional regulator n=1 Tax=unclassified Novosphingobium TaxID=2644732 RepID=UPI000EBDC61A|nr:MULTISPECIES: helix-turn-helix domain-containing protein [unclassified Novosphingobium]HCF24325.1 TetR family transcriptional regulator [Novosphingobium sp.]HQV03911.1 helix-turn-helix domain-containing protein [Novosphingobium sp.]